MVTFSHYSNYSTTHLIMMENKRDLNEVYLKFPIREENGDDHRTMTSASYK